MDRNFGFGVKVYPIIQNNLISKPFVWESTGVYQKAERCLAMTDEKQRISLFFDKKFVEKMDKEINSAGFKSRNDFVVYAVNSYFADKVLSDENSVVNEKLAKEIANASEEQQKRISKGLFRYAVELELIMKILAEEKHFSKKNLEEMRKEAINNVRRTRGKVRLDGLFERKDYQSL